MVIVKIKLKIKIKIKIKRKILNKIVTIKIVKILILKKIKKYICFMQLLI